MVILMYAAANSLAFAFDGMETRSQWVCQGAL